MPLPPALAGTVEWVADGVGLMRPPEGYTSGAASLVLDEGGDIVLVDAGLPPDVRRKLSPHVEVCLLTHCHVAHAHGARDFREVWAPREEANALHSADDFLTTYDVARRDRDVVASAIRKAGYEASHVAKRLQPGGILRVGTAEWHLMRAPGHSPGMLALLDPKRHILFVADLDSETSAWYGFPNSDPTALEHTANTLAEVPVAILASSHGPVRKRGIKQMFREISESIRERDRKLLAVLEHPRSLEELTDMGICSGKPQTQIERYHERVMVEKHLARLMEKDYAAARQDGRFQRVG